MQTSSRHEHHITCWHTSGHPKYRCIHHCDDHTVNLYLQPGNKIYLIYVNIDVVQFVVWNIEVKRKQSSKQTIPGGLNCFIISSAVN